MNSHGMHFVIDATLLGQKRYLKAESKLLRGNGDKKQPGLPGRDHRLRTCFAWRILKPVTLPAKTFCARRSDDTDAGWSQIASVDYTEARNEILGCFGRSDRSAQVGKLLVKYRALNARGRHGGRRRPRARASASHGRGQEP